MSNEDKEGYHHECPAILTSNHESLLRSQSVGLLGKGSGVWFSHHKSGIVNAQDLGTEGKDTLSVDCVKNKVAMECTRKGKRKMAIFFCDNAII